MSGPPGLAEAGGKQVLAGLDAEARLRNDGALAGVFDGLDAEALRRSGGPWVCVFDGASHWMRFGVVPEASDEIAGEVQLMSDEAAFAASGGLDVEALLRSDGPWIDAFGGALLMTSSGRGLLASAVAFQQTGGEFAIAAAGGASPQRSGEQELGASG